MFNKKKHVNRLCENGLLNAAAKSQKVKGTWYRRVTQSCQITPVLAVTASASLSSDLKGFQEVVVHVIRNETEILNTT